VEDNKKSLLKVVDNIKNIAIVLNDKEVINKIENEKIDEITTNLVKFNNFLEELKMKIIENFNINSLNKSFFKHIDIATGKETFDFVRLSAIYTSKPNFEDLEKMVKIYNKLDKKKDKINPILNSTNKTIKKLKQKNGKIETHQRSIKVTAEGIKKVRNKNIIDIALDKKNNKKILYKDLKKKTGLLIGGTVLTIPNQIVNLEPSIKSVKN